MVPPDGEFALLNHRTTPPHLPPHPHPAEAFDTERAISMVPPDGEFALLNYRTTHGLSPPFRLAISVDADPSSDTKALVSLRLFSDVPHDKVRPFPCPPGHFVPFARRGCGRRLGQQTAAGSAAALAACRCQAYVPLRPSSHPHPATP
jgi:hypothetical protein